MGMQIGDISPDIDASPVTGERSFLERYERIIRSWGYEIQEVSEIILGESMLGFWHNGQLVYCPAEPQDIYTARVQFANKIEESLPLVH